MKRIGNIFALLCISLALSKMSADCLVTPSDCLSCSACATTSEKICPPCQCCDLISCDNNVYGKTHFTGRSQSRALYRWLVGTHDELYRYDMDRLSGLFSVITEYSQTFRNDRIATFVLPTGNNCFRFGPDTTAVDPETAVTFDQSTNVRGQDFGLSSTTVACVCFNPSYKNFIADFHLDLALDNCYAGIFGYVDIPVVHVSVDPNCCITEVEPGTSCFIPMGLMSGSIGGQDVRVLNPMDALSGNITWGDVTSDLCKGILCGCGIQTKTGVADIRAGLGYNLLLTECAHLGIKVVAAAPTGNTPQGRFVFEPIIGNQGHWELGAGVVAHTILWQKNDDQAVSFHLDSEFTHMFKSREQIRLFDLTDNGPWSRYLLLKQFGTNATTGAPFYTALERGPNVFAQKMKVKIDVQADVVALLSYTHCNFVADLGYNFWGRSREKATDVCCCIPNNTYGIKGAIPVAGDLPFDLVGTCFQADFPDLPDTSFNVTASRSTISTTSGIFGPNDCKTVEFVSCSDLDICSALHPSAWSHSVIANLGYLWQDCDYTPFFGLGAKVEFSGKHNTAFNAWSIWTKGAISF